MSSLIFKEFRYFIFQNPICNVMKKNEEIPTGKYLDLIAIECILTNLN